MLMKLVVGLGNPGRKFAKTRHNTGHLFISKIKNKKLKIGDQVKLYQTTVFMNDSGKEVNELISNFQVPISNLLIVHDDMDLPLGKFKLQFGRSAAGHKGVQSIIDALGTKGFWRLRIGIGPPPVGMPGDNFVLEKFTPQELKILQRTLEEAYLRVLEWAR